MMFNREKLFAVSWRIALIVLPWQTRWMHPAALINWPWEQGTVAAYVSWLPMLASILLGWSLAKQHMNKKTLKIIGVCLFALVVSSAAAILMGDVTVRQSRALAVGQWWVQAMVLAAFCLTLWRAVVDRTAIVRWFVYSLIPHAVLAWGQYFFQASPQNKWLGLAYHAGKELGTSAIERGEYRIMRVYGGFPHPNIFGGWLALALPFAFFEVIHATNKLKVLLYSVISALFASVLVLTYSRSAWLAFAIGCVFFVVHAKRKSLFSGLNKQFLIIASLFVLILSGTVIYTQWFFISARMSAEERLEVKSLTARADGLRQGIELLQKKPVVGSGPNSVLLDIAADVKATFIREPLEPPHNAYVLAVDEVGIVGLIAMIVLAAYIWRASSMNMPLIVIGIVALLDHYPWSTWSGQALLMVCVLIASLPYIRMPEEGSKV